MHKISGHRKIHIDYASTRRLRGICCGLGRQGSSRCTVPGRQGVNKITVQFSAWMAWKGTSCRNEGECLAGRVCVALLLAGRGRWGKGWHVGQIVPIVVITGRCQECGLTLDIACACTDARGLSAHHHQLAALKRRVSCVQDKSSSSHATAPFADPTGFKL